MIDIRKLKELVKLMVENDLSELDLRDQEEKVTIKRGADGVPMIAAPMPAPVAMNGEAAPAPAPASDAPAAGGDEIPAGLVAIESPMVGTFYSAANPDSDPFVSVGASVSSDTVVCLVEAMKVFNEIKAETSGVIERVLVESGEAVEFGQKLYLVKPS
ncbi:MAG: acetyl-CoA carboxylase biotin carboxyl carrier protein [Planctomycetota bacterium]